MTSEPPLLEVESLTVVTAAARPIIEDISLSIAGGETLGVVGESGSGKSTLALALLGYSRPGARIAAGRVRVNGEDVIGPSERRLRSLRGGLVSYVAQDPATALNPSLRVDDQIAEMLRAHPGSGDIDARITEVLAQADLPTDRDFRRRYPHQLSGGQQQRLALAIALVCRPSLVVLDEPTTGLDVLTQSRILDEIRRLREELHISFVYVSHDLAVVAGVADRVAVMYAGRIVEEAEASRILRAPRHPYTFGLLSSVPDHVAPRVLRGIPGVAVGVDDRPAGCAFAPRCAHRVEACLLAVPALAETEPAWRVRCIRWTETPVLRFVPRSDLGATTWRPVLEVEGLYATHRSRGREIVAASGVSFFLEAGQCVALVGASGSGKTTIARCIAGLHRPKTGRILLGGEPLAALARERPRRARQLLQIVFQNPYESLNPRHQVRDIVARPAELLAGLNPREARSRVDELLERVRLPARIADRYPGELSGGERQRTAIARALAASPEVMVCDEITSALDVSVQAAVLELLDELRRELGLALLFITHDLGVVASIADHVLVLEEGQICEQGPVRSVLEAPKAPYTCALIEAAPSLDVEARAV